MCRDRESKSDVDSYQLDQSAADISAVLGPGLRVVLDRHPRWPKVQCQPAEMLLTLSGNLQWQTENQEGIEAMADRNGRGFGVGSHDGSRAIGFPGKHDHRFQTNHCQQCRESSVSNLRYGKWCPAVSHGRDFWSLRIDRSARVRLSAEVPCTVISRQAPPCTAIGFRRSTAMSFPDQYPVGSGAWWESMRITGRDGVGGRN